MALRAGAADGGHDFTSWTIAAELAWPLRARHFPALHLVAGAGLALGQTASLTGTDVPRSKLRQLDVTLGIRLRVPLTPRLHIDVGTGLGWAFADATVSSSADGESHRLSDGAPLLYLGNALGLRLGRGDALLDLRWNDIRLAGETGITGVALGLTVTLGYGLRL